MYAKEEIREILRREPPLPHYQVKRLADLLRRNGIDPFNLAEILAVADGFPELGRDLRRLQPEIHPDLMRLKAAEQSVRQLTRGLSNTDHPPNEGARPSLCQEMWWQWGVIFPPFEFTLQTTLTEERDVRSAITHVLDMYPILRASFVFKKGRLELIFNESADFVLEHPQGRSRSIGSGPSSPLDAFPAWGAPIANDACWQIRILAMPDRGGMYTLLFNIGHMIFDEASIGILVKKLGQIFCDLSQDRRSTYPVDNTYFEIARRERDWMENGDGTALLDYWKAALQGWPVIVSPRGRRLEHWQTGLSAHCSLIFDQSVRRRLANTARELKTSMLVVILYVLAKAISLWSSADQIVIRNLRNKRDSLRTLNMVGFWTAADIICARDIHRHPAEVVRDISLSLDCARRLNLPQQPGDWLRVQKTIPLTLNYMTDTTSENSLERDGPSLGSHRNDLNFHMSSPEQAEKPNIVISIRDNGRAMHLTAMFADVSGDGGDENDLVDLIFAEFTASNRREA